MAYKIDIREIVRHHFRTLVNDSTGKPDFRDYFIFLIMPIAISWYLGFKNISINKDFIDPMISGISIYIGLSLNLIVLLYEISQKPNTNLNKEILLEMVANITFSILMSILCIIAALFTLLDNPLAGLIASGITYFLLIEVLLIILMILKRMYYQIINQINKDND